MHTLASAVAVSSAASAFAFMVPAAREVCLAALRRCPIGLSIRLISTLLYALFTIPSAGA